MENVYGDGIKIDSTAFVHSDYPIVAVQKRFSNKSPKSYEFIYKLARRKSDKKPLHTYVWANKDVLDFEVEREKTKDSFAGKVAVICDNPQGDIAFFIVLTDNFEKNDFNAQMETLKSKIANEGWAGLRMSHQKKWADFWAKSKISIPDKRIEATYDTALYNLKC